MYSLTEKMYHEIVSKTMQISEIELKFSHRNNGSLVEIIKYDDNFGIIGKITIYPKNISYQTDDKYVWIAQVEMYDIFDKWRGFE